MPSLEFDAIDGKPVRVFFLIVSDPRTTSPHIRVLSRISRILNDKARREALEHAGHLISEGADILDIGGESTRPGSRQVDQDDNHAEHEQHQDGG